MKRIERAARVQRAAARSGSFLTTNELEHFEVNRSTRTAWVRDGVLYRIQQGVFSTKPGPYEFDEMLHLGDRVMTGQQAFASRTALALQDYPGGLRSRPELIGPPGVGTKSVHLTRHRAKDLRPVDLHVRNGRRITTPLRSILDSSPRLDDAQIGEALTVGVDRSDFTYADVVNRCLELRRRGKTGVARVQEMAAIRLGDPSLAACNPFEALMLGIIRRNRLPEPVPQFRVVINGQVYFLDFAWPWLRKFLECDSMLAHSTPEQLNSDLKRQNALLASGWTGARFTYWHVVREEEMVVAALRQMLTLAA